MRNELPAMMKDAISLADRSMAWCRYWVADLPWKGFAVLLAVCLVNALRRNINSRFLREDLTEWFIDVRDATFSGLVIGMLVVLAVIGSYNRLQSRRTGLRYGATVAAAAVASALGAVFVVGFDTDWTFVEETFANHIVSVKGLFLGTWPRYLLYACLFAFVYVFLRQRRDAENEMRRLDAERAEFEQRTTEARLQRLQAQIEPHFLFNTLAHVKRLYQTDRLAGRAMLDKLMQYLTAALPQMRERDSTVAQEIVLTQAYLGIQQIRMGRRLQFQLDVHDSVGAARLPPMMLLTLVENAIKHGLSPAPEGGKITVRAGRERGHLVVDVVDTGRGFTTASGGGAGLANVRARLSALHGAAARLSLASNQPHGVAATLRLPFALESGTPGPP
jgi:sensor histidine kinase YesM